MKRSTKKKLKKLKKQLTARNIAIVICIIVIIIAIVATIVSNSNGSGSGNQETSKTSKTVNTARNNNVKVVKSSSNGKEISEKDARKLAKKQFKELNEDIKEDELEVREILRADEKYYYITSRENTCEIKKSTGEITRINSVKVE